MQTRTLFSNESASEANWTMVSDQVMGGLSHGQMQMTEQGVNMQGSVSLENNGGFLQIQWPMSGFVDDINMQSYQGVYIEWCSHQTQELALLFKSTQLWMPWQSYRAQATASPEWQTIYLPFEAFTPYRTQTLLKPQRINKFSVLAGGQAMQVNVTVRQFGLYK